MITYILLSGSPPFGGKNEKAIMQNVKTGKYDFYGDAWKNVSDNAKDFVQKLMEYDPKKRLTAK